MVTESVVSAAPEPSVSKKLHLEYVDTLFCRVKYAKTFSAMGP